jgi:CubicO group peptidase (beta-lactamase class C family)
MAIRAASFNYGTARNWARIGLLYQQDGLWQGQRPLPEGWAKFVSTPAAAWKQPVYGGLFWVNGDGAWNIPKTAYFANGAGGQRTFIIPTHDIVVVRMGHYRGDRAGMRTLNAALQELMLAVEARP